ncbi:MAG: PKD domain-containing protein [Flavobacteriales bacterium]|nr:PKD domain-containing protein [Flavobacteriales bacterium]
MKKDLNNIEDLFKEAFNGFEADVDSSVWTNIQQQIGSVANSSPSGNSGVVSSGVTKSVLVKIAAGVVIATGISVAAYQIFSPEKIEETNTISLSHNPTINEHIEVESNENQAGKNIVIDKTKHQEQEEQKVKIESKKSIVENDNQVQSVENNTQIKEDKIISVSSNNKAVTQPAINSNAITQKANANNNSEQEVEKLKAKIIASSIKGKAPFYVDFDVDGNATDYLWTFGDNTSSEDKNPTHSFEKPGKYTVVLTAKNKLNQTIICKQEITVNSSIVSKIATIPTVFSPNDDGMNDIIKVDGEYITQFKAVVRDIKGDVVFEWDSIDGFWDGKDMHNQIKPGGTYYLIVVATGEDGEKHTIKQSVQLFR